MMDKLKQQKIIEIEELALFTKLEDELKKGRWIGYNKAAASSATEARIVKETRDFIQKLINKKNYIFQQKTNSKFG